MNNDLEKVTKQFMDVTDHLAQTLAKKNIDYGDSFHKVYEQFGDVSTFIRLSDKLGRLSNLVKQEGMHIDESIEDTYLDIAGYAILTLVSRQRLLQLKSNVISDGVTYEKPRDE